VGEAVVVSLRPVDESQLRAVAAQARDDAADVVAVAGAPHWSGPDRVATEAGEVWVVACPSVLAVRETLAAHRDGQVGAGLVAIVTDRDEGELGEEVLAQVWGHRLVRPYGWEACKRLFHAEVLDAKLADQRWLVDLLVDHAPVRGYPPVAKGVLDADTAWRAFARHGLGLRADRPTVVDLVRWAEDGEGTKTLGRLGDDDRAQVIEGLVAEAGPGAKPVVRLVAHEGGHRAVNLGLQAGLLWSDQAVGDAAVSARTRFIERQGLLDGPDAEQAARSWARAAEQLAGQRLADEEPAVAALLADVEHQLAQLGAGDLVIGSDLLPGALPARLARLGEAITAAVVGTGELTAAVAALEHAAAHVGAKDHPEVDRARHAVRLTARLHAGAATSNRAPAADLADAARRWVDDGAWVDQARAAVAEGSTVAELADACAAVLDRADAERDAEDRRFAALLAEWNRVEPLADRTLLPIEGVLDTVVAPLAGQQPALLLVVDGLDHPTAHTLLGDIEGQGWQAQEPTDAAWPPVVSCLPSITHVSRASLLTGRVTAGEQPDERDGFAAHAGLGQADGEPALFHKRDLRVQEGRVGETVRAAIADRSRHAVGVVVNGVDDHLDKGGQLRLAEGLDGIKPLGWLLDAAAEAGRVVIVTSDHGHIAARRTQVRPADQGGERWRLAEPPAGDDEMGVAGPRVGRGDGSVVLPATDTIRYTPVGKLGYHGGATPQEVLCPLAAFAPASVELDGYAATEAVAPPWWWDPRADTAPQVAPVEPVAAPAAGPLPPADAHGRLQLFPDTTSERPADDRNGAAAGEAASSSNEGLAAWLDELLASPVLAAQRDRSGRTALDNADLVAFLTVLDRHSDVATSGTLQRETGIKGVRLRTKVQALRRTLSVDAYDVVSVDSDGTVRLNRDLLAEQFQLTRA
jgi:hypothetical protein